MRLACYVGTHDGFNGVFNRLIRWRYGGSFLRDGVASHCEVVFEPGDGVDHLMPDGTTAPDASGALWCASSSARDLMPTWSARRVGKTGGVRFKRIVLDPTKWEVLPYVRDPVQAAAFFKQVEGTPYDWVLILGFLYWPIALISRWIHDSLWCCSTVCAGAGGFERPDFYHPELLRTMHRPVTWSA